MTVTEIIPAVHGDGVTDDAAIIQAVIDAAVPGSIIALPCGVTCLISAPLKFTTAVGFNGHGSIIRATGPSAISISSVQPGSNYFGNRAPYQNINLVGPANSGTTVGLLIEASNIAFDGLNISNFPLGVSFGNNAYSVAIRNFQIYSNHTGVLFPYPVSDAGENIAFAQGSIFNNYIGLENDSGPNCTLSFAQTSFDYNATQILANNGRTMLCQCHVEGITSAPFRLTWNVNNWTALTVRDTDVVFGNSQASAVIPICINTFAGGASALFDNCFFFGFMQKPSLFSAWVSGAGASNVRFRNCTQGWADPTAVWNFGDFN